MALHNFAFQLILCRRYITLHSSRQLSHIINIYIYIDISVLCTARTTIFYLWFIKRAVNQKGVTTHYKILTDFPIVRNNFKYYIEFDLDLYSYQYPTTLRYIIIRIYCITV